MPRQGQASTNPPVPVPVQLKRDTLGSTLWSQEVSHVQALSPSEV
jgi:hypothetical protein